MVYLHNVDTIVNIVKAEWEFHALEECCTNANMTIESFNNKKGQAIQDCLDPTTGFLKILQGGVVGNCRPDGIMHVKVKVVCNFGLLDKNNKPQIIYITFLRLEVETNSVLNTGGTSRDLTTYAGASNLIGLSYGDFSKLIFTHSESIDMPYDLDEPTFSGTDAPINGEKKKKKFLIKYIR